MLIDTYITLPTKVHLVKAIVFPVIMYGCESWTIEKAECQRIDAFELWCWRRLLRVPWTARCNQSILKEIGPGCSLEWCWSWNSNTLMWRTDSFEKTLMLGKIEGKRRRVWRGWDGCMASLTQWTWVWVNSGSWWWTGRPRVCCSPWGRKESDMTEQLNWTDFKQLSTELPALHSHVIPIATVLCENHKLTQYCIQINLLSAAHWPRRAS